MSFKILLTYIMGLGYIWVGISHFYNTDFFLKIMPPSFPFHLESVYLSGFFEIIFGMGIMIKFFRKYASWGLILLLIAVYPANIYLAFNEVAQNKIGISSFMASWVRLPIQFILIGLAYLVSKIKS
ncbi:DoxX family protein [Bacteroidota bacterium]|nr:DoxX family protein [Bacteroidota bacterium]RPG79705.1 MAG: DoxX family protein [Crocinitomicaceae bacterium TMED135]|tara:strand:- start:218 stop:595 length:378 start_codon:yes stop_codon:yes gene_type:complete